MRIDEHSQRLLVRRLNRGRVLHALSGSVWLFFVLALCLPSCERREIPSRIGEESAADDRETTRPPVEPGGGTTARAAANQAIRIEVTAIDADPALSMVEAPGHSFLVLETRWENIHVPRMIPKSNLEGKADRTMGVGALTGGGDEEELVEVAVAYRVPKWVDHVYLLADGVAYPLHSASAEIPGGVVPSAALEIADRGEVIEVALLFEPPRGADDLALRLFDYSNGHVTVPLRGKERRAVGDGRPPRDAIGDAATGDLHLATLGVYFRQDYRAQLAPPEHRWAIVDLAGKSSSSGGGVGNIVEIDPGGYLWLVTDGGYLHYAEPREALRFTPEIFQRQEVAFVVPASAERLTLGARIGNEVVRLPLTDRAPSGMPDPTGRHLDGEVMEVQFLGSRREGELVVLDLCIRPLAEGRGIEIQPAAQFVLQAGASQATVDARSTATLAHAPPAPFVVPPETPVRFELAYRTRNTPDALEIRGFASEGRIEL